MKPRPFLKWAGGKRGLLEQLRPMVPRSFARYHEPFVGGGAMFFDLTPGQAALSDANEELVNCYQCIQRSPLMVTAEIRALTIDEETFYRVRGTPPSSLSPFARAARTIYLNKTCFNGLYRVNRRGQFNAPWGKWTKESMPLVLDEQNLITCSAALQGATVLHLDFEQALANVGEGDFVYLDPPYASAAAPGKVRSFTSYTAGGFGRGDLERLASKCHELSLTGAKFMLSNADTPETREAFDGFCIDTVLARRSVNSDASGRGKVGEIAVRNYEERSE